MAKPLATLGILSVGDMGVGIARLLSANNYRVITNAADRRYLSFFHPSRRPGSICSRTSIAKPPKVERATTTSPSSQQIWSCATRRTTSSPSCLSETQSPLRSAS